MKRQPEDIGLKPDGDSAAGNGATNQNKASSKRRKVNADTERFYTLREVLRLKSFYLLLLSFCIAFFAGSGVLPPVTSAYGSWAFNVTGSSCAYHLGKFRHHWNCSRRFPER